ncbi:MAG: ABC transporter substrate-binding protein [Solirubrobacteraceae bacterium]|nr:ABC transporter substrate-binding protein [Solirubrobacteraceae bacterium]
MKHSLRALLALILLAALTAAGCGSGDDDGATGATGTAAATAAAGSGGSEAPEKITIAYQAIPNGDLIVKHNGWLEEAFPDTEIEWKIFDSGGSVIEAVAASSIDIGLAGSSPVSRGLSNGIAFQVPWIFDVIGEAEALVVRDDIASVEDLKGRKIAAPLASTTHYSLLAAIEDAGLSAGDVDIIDAEPDEIYAAWTRGDIDGAYVWNPNLARIVDEGGRIILTSAEMAERGKTTYDLALVTDEFATKYPDAVTEWVRQQDRAVRLIKDDPQAAAEAIAAELNLTAEEVLPQIKGLIYLTAAEQAGPDYLGGKLGKDLFETAKFNQEVGEIPDVRPEADYEKAVNPTFARQAAG